MTKAADTIQAGSSFHDDQLEYTTVLIFQD